MTGRGRVEGTRDASLIPCLRVCFYVSRSGGRPSSSVPISCTEPSVCVIFTGSIKRLLEHPCPLTWRRKARSGLRCLQSRWWTHRSGGIHSVGRHQLRLLKRSVMKRWYTCWRASTSSSSLSSWMASMGRGRVKGRGIVKGRMMHHWDSSIGRTPMATGSKAGIPFDTMSLPHKYIYIFDSRRIYIYILLLPSRPHQCDCQAPPEPCPVGVAYPQSPLHPTSARGCV